MPGTFPPAADFKGNYYIATPACITARAWRTCRDACRDRLPAVTGKTFPAFPAHAHPQFCVSGKRPITHTDIYIYIIYIYIYPNNQTPNRQICKFPRFTQFIRIHTTHSLLFKLMLWPKSLMINNTNLPLVNVSFLWTFEGYVIAARTYWEKLKWC